MLKKRRLQGKGAMNQAGAIGSLFLSAHDPSFLCLRILLLIRNLAQAECLSESPGLPVTSVQFLYRAS